MKVRYFKHQMDHACDFISKNNVHVIMDPTQVKKEIHNLMNRWAKKSDVAVIGSMGVFINFSEEDEDGVFAEITVDPGLCKSDDYKFEEYECS